jgi:hypothetical protein
MGAIGAKMRSRPARQRRRAAIGKANFSVYLPPGYIFAGVSPAATIERKKPMSLRINDIAPDFTAETTAGTIGFHEWIGDGWAVLFSHPKNFTPVCTTELGAMAGLEGEFRKRGVKIIGISVDPVESHG